MIFKKSLKNIVNKKQKILLIFLLFASIILSFLEMIGIGSIAIFVAILSDSQSFIQKYLLNNYRVIYQKLMLMT